MFLKYIEGIECNDNNASSSKDKTEEKSNAEIDFKLISSKRKKALRQKRNIPSKTKIKIHEEYNKDATRIKPGGNKNGAWFSRANENLSKQSPWLFKEGAGYSLFNNNPIPINIINEICSIKEAYIGEFYQILIPDHVPKTRLVVKETESQCTPNFLIASKEIPDFTDFAKLQEKNISIYKTFPPEKYGKQITKVVLVSIILGETDLNKGNMGVVNEVYKKIDHGESIFLDGTGMEFKEPLNFTPENLSRLTGLSPDYFTLENINEALKEIADIIKNNRNEFIETEKKYEPILSDYRVIYHKNVYFLLGRKENTIADLIEKRLDQTEDLFKKNIFEL